GTPWALSPPIPASTAPPQPRCNNAAIELQRALRLVGRRTTEPAKGGVMSKLFIIGALVAALAGPASAAGHRSPARHPRGKVLCPQSVIFLPGRAFATCGGRFWIRDPQTGQIVSVPFWRLQHLNDPPDGPELP